MTLDTLTFIEKYFELRILFPREFPDLPRDFEEQRQKLWYEHLEDIPDSIFVRACESVIRTEKFLLVSTIREHAAKLADMGDLESAPS